METKQPEAPKKDARQSQSPQRGGDHRGGGNRGRKGGGRRSNRREESEFDQKIIDVARVTRVTEGGKQMSFRATVVIGDKKGKVGIGLGKGLDVSNAINKAVGRAKKDMIHVPLDEFGRIPHEVVKKFGAAKIMVRPAPQGTGIIAGGVMRMILELAGARNVTAKMHGSKSKINNSKATIEALRSLQTDEQRKVRRGV